VIKQTTKYETEDGSLFNTQEEAQQHIDQVSNSNSLYVFIEEMQSQLVYTSIDECELHEFFVNNAKALREVLKVWDV
jgi:hypothetical protein